MYTNELRKKGLGFTMHYVCRFARVLIGLTTQMSLDKFAYGAYVHVVLLSSQYNVSHQHSVQHDTMVHLQSSTWETDKQMQPEKHDVSKDNNSGCDREII